MGPALSLMIVGIDDVETIFVTLMPDPGKLAVVLSETPAVQAKLLAGQPLVDKRRTRGYNRS